MIAWLMASTALAQEPSWTVTVDPLTWSLGYAHVQVERRVSKRVSVYAGPHARLFSGILTDPPEPFIGVGAEVGVRYFPWGKSPKGAWVMGRQVLAGITATDGTAPLRPGGYSSALVGYTGIIGGHFVLSGGAGLNVLYYTAGSYGTRGLLPALHTNIGYAF